MTPGVRKQQPTPIELAREARRLALLRGATQLGGRREGGPDERRAHADDHDDDPKVAA